MDINAEITLALEKTPISSGNNLLGFQIDIDAYLEDSGIFQDIRVKKTSDPHSAIIARCIVSDPGLSKVDVSEVLEGVWLENLRYQYWEAHTIIVSEGEVSLIFVTTNGETEHDLCVTGRIEVTGFGNYNDSYGS